MTDREKLIKILVSLNLPDECDEALGWMADKLIANGVTFATDTNVGSKWISVGEEPQDNADRYLVLFEDGYVCSAYYDPCIDDACRFGQYRNYYHPDTLGFLDSEFWSYEGVTHWMPLPEPPGED